MVHDSSYSIPSSASVVWWFCGRVPLRESRRLRGAFQIHEYSSTSVPPYSWAKDIVKHWTQPRPDYRIYQNSWIRERMGFADGVPHALRDMGLAEYFFEAQPPTQTPEFDLIYLGDMPPLLTFIPVMQAIKAAGRSLLLVGDVSIDLKKHLPSNVTCMCRVDQLQVPRQLQRARFGLNLVPNANPFQQQTSAKVLEYCASGLRVVSNAYPWIQYFMAQNKANFYLLRDDSLSPIANFGEALEAYPYIVPDMHAFSWNQILNKLPLWRIILR